jgi:hypothetical protein
MPSISTGLLLGFALLRVSLSVDPAGRTVPLWQDVIVAVAYFSVFRLEAVDRAALAGVGGHAGPSWWWGALIGLSGGLVRQIVN